MSSLKTALIALVVTVIVGVALFFGLQHVFQPKAPLAGALLAENYNPTIRTAGGFNTNYPFTASNVSILNNTVFGIGPSGASTELTASTANGNTFTMTAAQFCNLTSLVAPSSNTTTVTIVFPSQAATAALCGGLPQGAFAFAFLDNESSSNMNLATTTGSNLTFMVATGTAAFMSSYPPKVPAQTIVEAASFATSSTADVMMLSPFNYGTNF